MDETVNDRHVLLDREEVITLIREYDLEEHRDVILAAIEPGYRLRPDANGSHRIGGPPDLAPEEQWPVDADGVPYTFVAQFECAQLSAS